MSGFGVLRKAKTLALPEMNKGERNPTIITLWHVAKALGVKIRALFDESAGASRKR
jgi:transcriptional regulator with XRE-family HTH domain